MPATYDDLREELWYIPLDKIKKALMDDPAIVNVGDNTYFYAPNLPVSKEEQRVIASELESELGYHSYTTTAQLMKLIHENVRRLRSIRKDFLRLRYETVCLTF